MTDGVGLSPDHKTFLLLLNSCRHSGEVKIARDLWTDIACKGFKDQVIAVYIDCVASNGDLQESYEMALDHDHIKETDNKMMWMSVLNACTKHKDRDLAQRVYNEIHQRYGEAAAHNDFMSAASQLLSNVFAE